MEKKSVTFYSGVFVCIKLAENWACPEMGLQRILAKLLLPRILKNADLNMQLSSAKGMGRCVFMAFPVYKMTVNKLHWNVFGVGQEYKISVLCPTKS